MSQLLLNGKDFQAEPRGPAAPVRPREVVLPANPVRQRPKQALPYSGHSLSVQGREEGLSGGVSTATAAPGSRAVNSVPREEPHFSS